MWGERFDASPGDLFSSAMRQRQGGWRSARFVAPAPQVGPTEATPAQTPPGFESPRPQVATQRRLQRRQPAREAFGALVGRARAVPPEWSLSLIGVLAYIAAAVTYRVPVATPAMVLAVAGLFFERRITVPLFVGLFALFLTWATFGYTASIDQATTMDQTIVMSKILLICFVIANVSRTSWRMRVFMIFFLACFAAFPARGTMVNYFIVRYTIFGRALWNYIYSNPNDLAALTFFPLSLSVAVALTEPKGWIKRAAVVGTAVLPLMILVTQSRGALIGLVASGLIFFMLHSRGRRLKSLLAAGAVAVVLLPFVPSSAWTRFAGMVNLTSVQTIAEADPEGSAEARWNIWRVAGTIIKENPVTGIGLGVYPRAHAMYSVRVGVPVTAIGFRDTHSTYLNVAAETGVPGLALFLLMVGVVVVSCERTRQKARGSPRAEQLLALELGLLAFMLAGIFGSFAKLSFLYIQLAVMWAVADITKRELAATTRQPVRGSSGASAAMQRLAAG